jgi:MFS family permease
VTSAPASAPSPRASVPALAALSVTSLVVAQLPTFLTGAVGVQLQRDLGFGATELGAAIGASLAMSFLGSVAFGRLVQRHGWTAGMRFAAVLAAVSMGGVALLADSWIPLVALLILGGVAKSAGHPAANLAIAMESPRNRQGLLFGIKQAGVPAAAMLGGLSVPLVVIDHGWRAAFGLSAMLAIAFIAFVPRRPRQLTTGGGTSSRKVIEPETRRLALVVLAAGAGAGVAVSNSVAGFLTTYSVQIGISEGSAGILLAVASFAGLAGRVLVGWISDRIELGLGTVALLLMSGGGGVALMTTQQQELVAIGSVIAFGAGWAWAGIFNLAVVRRNPSAPAIATGYTQAGVYAGAGIGPFLFGAVAEAASFVVAWWLIAAVAVLAAVIMLVGDRASLSGNLAVVD